MLVAVNDVDLLQRIASKSPMCNVPIIGYKQIIGFVLLTAKGMMLLTVTVAPCLHLLGNLFDNRHEHEYGDEEFLTCYKEQLVFQGKQTHYLIFDMDASLNKR